MSDHIASVLKRLRSAVRVVVAVSLAGMASAAGAGDTPAHSLVAVARTSTAESAPLRERLTIGMPYVVPPHVPGSKVRTPEGPAPLLIERLSKQLPLRAVAVPDRGDGDTPAAWPGEVDALLRPVGDTGAGRREGVVIPTGYRAGIMAIMRTDTDIKTWEDLRGRSVCLTEGSGLAGRMQARYGATEKVFRAPADALLDLRIGGCDAAVHDSTMLEALLAYPEWKKFSARLPVQETRELAFVLPGDDPELARTLQSQVKAWQEADLLAKLTKQSARDIAFEVYLDQEVPDCH